MPFSRTDLTFSSGPSGSETCAAWLYLPDSHQDTDRRPVLVMAHGFGALKEMRLDAYAERFVAAGYACLVFDYRHFGGSSGQPRQLLDVGRQRADWADAIRFARTQVPGVDPAKVVLWGTSFAGGHALAVGAQDQEVAAVVVQCPFTNGIASLRSLRSRSRGSVTGLAVRDGLAALRGREPVMVDLIGPPGSRAMMTTPDAVEGYDALKPPGLTMPMQVAARIGLHLPLQAPGRAAKKLSCPAFFAVCDRDLLTPPKPTLKYASACPRAEVRRYPIGHFDIYLGEHFETATNHMLDFLARTVPAE